MSQATNERANWIVLSQREWQALHTARRVLNRISKSVSEDGDRFTFVHGATAIEVFLRDYEIEVRA